jgi:CelD/BcsL family acetyltransferase involved in cellulose biosynthesis
VAQWVDTFATGQDFRAVVLRKGDRFVAAIPLVHRRVGRLVDAYDLPGNEWSAAGDLLLDAREDRASLCHQLVRELSLLPRSLFWFNAVTFNSDRWQHLTSALRQAEVPTQLQHRYDVGWLETTGTWQETEKTWSKNFRRQLRKSKRQLEATGPVRVEVRRPHDDHQLAETLDQCLQLEHAGWKGRAGSSMLSDHVIRDFVVAQARQLAKWKHVEFALLWCDDQLVAFEYAWRAKGVYHAFKVAYDERFAQYSPGQLLTGMMLEHQVASAEYLGVDCMGPVNDATRRWSPELRRTGRMVFAPRIVGRAFLYAYRQLSPSWRRWRNMVTSSSA